MPSHSLTYFLLRFSFLLQISLTHSAVVPQSVDIASTNATLSTDWSYCVDNEGWVGDGILASDCTEAIREFHRTNVKPRGRQEYEFLTYRDRRISHLPYISTPWKYDIGTCVIVIVMLDTFYPSTLPGAEDPQTYTRTDIATFNEIYSVAVSLSSACVKTKVIPEAGWSFAGVASSIGVLILRSGSDLDKVLVRL